MNTTRYFIRLATMLSLLAYLSTGRVAAQPAAPEKREEVWRPALTWTLPTGWKVGGPDAANVGRFTAGEASVAITALTSMEGKETVLVNMWRQVRGLEPLEEAEAKRALAEVPVAGAKGGMFEFADARAENARVVIVFTHRPEGSLFFKLQGPDAMVTAQKPAFFEFLKSVKFSQGTLPAIAPVRVEDAAQSRYAQDNDIAALTRKAESGDLRAAAILSAHWREGFGVPADIPKALGYARQSAFEQHPLGLKSLVSCPLSP